jgi:predicted nucleic acid-binding protein
LLKHIDLCTTLFPEETCTLWVDIMDESRSVGRPIATADAWIAATARQWELPLVTTDHQDFEHLDGLVLVPVV